MHSVCIFKLEDVRNERVPKWWLKFMDDYKVSAVHDAIELNKILEEHNAVFRTTQEKSPYGDRYIDFNTEEDAVMFLLRYQQ